MIAKTEIVHWLVSSVGHLLGGLTEDTELLGGRFVANYLLEIFNKFKFYTQCTDFLLLLYHSKMVVQGNLLALFGRPTPLHGICK